MNNVTIYNNFLEVERIIGNKEEFDYSFNYNSLKNIFEEEFLKFISVYNYFFFDENKKCITTIINSYPCALEDSIIMHLKKLYTTSKKLNKRTYKQVIAEFLFSYEKSLQTDKYKKDLGQNELKKYKGFLYKNFSRDNFETNGEIFQDTIDFYENIVNYSRKNNIFIGLDQKIRILSKFDENNKNTNEYKKIFNYILEQNKNLSQLIKYDYNISEHMQQYKNKILCTTENRYSSEEAVNIFKEVVDNVDNLEELIKSFINKYINICNNLIKSALLRTDNSILAISNFEQVIKELNKIKETNINNYFKQKIKECICQVLYAKRKILTDTEYINSKLQEHIFGFEISNKEIDKMHKDILNNFWKIYSYMKINFDDMISQSIKEYSNYALKHLITNIKIGNNG